MKLLDNIVVVDFSQFLSGPSASLRLADLGAEVIKIERPITGDICRQLYVSDITLDGESTIFHAINRNKKSFVADLKDPAAVETIKRLLAKADVMIHNFRPGVMDALGLNYDVVRGINPGIIYAGISGYGDEGPWRDRPGQDLLIQSVSGLTNLSGDKDNDPIPMGVAVTDIYAGAHLAQGILAALFQKNMTGTGSQVSVSMLESAIDFQFEVLTSAFNDDGKLPVRSAVNGAHAFIGAPYGIYETADGFIALAMGSIVVLGRLLECKALEPFDDPAQWFSERDRIKLILAEHLKAKPSRAWLDMLEPADIWCAEVLDYDRLMHEEGYSALQMEQVVSTATGMKIKTTRCPIRIDGEILTSEAGAPSLGEHNILIGEKFNLDH